MSGTVTASKTLEASFVWNDDAPLKQPKELVVVYEGCLATAV